MNAVAEKWDNVLLLATSPLSAETVDEMFDEMSKEIEYLELALEKRDESAEVAIDPEEAEAVLLDEIMEHDEDGEIIAEFEERIGELKAELTAAHSEIESLRLRLGEMTTAFESSRTETREAEVDLAVAQARVAELEVSLKGQREGINNEVLQRYAARIAEAREKQGNVLGASPLVEEVIATLADEVQRLENQDCNDTMLASGLAGDLHLLTEPYMTDAEKAAYARGNCDGVYAHTGETQRDAAWGRELRNKARFWIKNLERARKWLDDMAAQHPEVEGGLAEILCALDMVIGEKK
jgi:chromosome segregation ATPase